MMGTLEYDFVVSSWNMTETGGYLTCSCRIYRTLLDLSDSTDPMKVLDNNGATCMHCRFMKENVLPNINIQPNQILSAMQLFIQNSLDYRNATIVDQSSRQKTKKFSVIDNDTLSFVNFTYNRRIDRFIVSCDNGYCTS